MSLPDVIKLNGNDSQPAARIISPNPGQSVYRIINSDGSVYTFTVSQTDNKRRMRHVFRMESAAPKNPTTGTTSSSSITLTFDEPSGFVWTRGQVKGLWTSLAATLNDTIIDKILNQEI